MVDPMFCGSKHAACVIAAQCSMPEITKEYFVGLDGKWLA